MFYKELELVDNLSLYDSSLQKNSIYVKDGIIEVEIILRLDYPLGTYVKLLFKNVIDYSFSWNKDFDFYIIDSYKLLKTEDNIYYCSLDPFDRELCISEEDEDIIKSRDIEVYYSFDIKFRESQKINFNN
jgi:hypothetical protein